VTDGVHAAMNPMQPASSDPPLDCIVGNPGCPELSNRQYSVLTLSDPADALIACGVFLVDMTYKPPRHTNSPLDTRLGS
jgi:hypothetical protein